MRQRVLITAGASGIGRAIAEAFHVKGADVFVCDVDTDGLTALAAKFEGIHTLVCDMSDRAQIEKMVSVAASALGGLDVLVNNAGVSGPTSPVAELRPDDWDYVLKVNLTGTFDVTRLAIPYLVATGGLIINMSSVAGRTGYPNRIGYSTSKWGLIGFTKTLSMELGDAGVRVNAILPGAVDGPRFQNVLASRAERAGQPLSVALEHALEKQSLKRLVNPGHVAELALFLASDAGQSISGAAIPVDCDLQSA
ncbi:SDR family oxidoreductase [Caballeronia novacaledonica]|uniref:SDR family oxidoreductase n=1 Tax=Caballeronia novacaledonica TaxID=1544861 RepID=A0AA37IGK9_9BURK|nr:SDR family oxidoreductase [Caballeronia novacaledonica]GJH29380.1 SDR family oxidoreductase [Caballeronia novacaledonica]